MGERYLHVYNVDGLVRLGARPCPHNTHQHASPTQAAAARQGAPCSPDLNWIEHMWGMLQSARDGLPVHTMDSLTKHIHMDWHALGQRKELLQRMAAGMRARCQKVIDNKGGHIERNIYT